MSLCVRAALLTMVCVCCLAGASPDVLSSIGQGDCETWRQQREGLSRKDQQLLGVHGVLRRDGRWMFSDRLIPGCATRTRMAEYFARVVAGQAGATLRRYGWLHSKDISTVTRVVWPLLGTGEAVPADGSFDDEKWALLRQPWLSESELVTILRYELSRQGLSPEATVCLLDRPIPSLIPQLRLIAASAQKAKDQAIFALALLHVCGQDVVRQLADLHKHFEDPTDLSVIERIQGKIQKGLAIDWADLEPLVHEW